MFKIGDNVVCIDISVRELDKNSTTAQEIDLFEFVVDGLMLNKIYTVKNVLSVDGFCIGIMFNTDNIYIPSRFKLLTVVRKEKLNKLCSK